MSRVLFLLSQMTGISIKGSHICHAEPRDFEAGLWGQPASVWNQLSPTEGGREPSDRPTNRGGSLWSPALLPFTLDPHVALCVALGSHLRDPYFSP